MVLGHIFSIFFVHFSVWCGVVSCGVGVAVLWSIRGGGVGRRHWVIVRNAVVFIAYDIYA